MSELRAIYDNRFAGAAEHRLAVWQVLTREFFQRWVPEDGTLLDLGAGYCEFTNTIKAGKKIAVDLNPSTEQMAGPDVQVLAQDVAEPWAVAPDSVDVVFTSNFFEHLPTKDALMRCLQQAHRVLRPGGRLIALGPNIRFCPDVYWDFIDHYLPLSDRSLSEALQIAGFGIEKVVPRFLPYTMANRRPNKIAVQFYLRLRPAWKIFGKQFLIIASKPAA
jgi:SAM-dependent methyltransferase